jgi:DNA-binding transcriptional regulator YiaG
MTFPRVSYSEFRAIPEGFVTIHSLAQGERTQPDPELLSKARVELADKRKIKGLAAIRLRKGLSQTQLANEMGTTQPRLSLWEKGEEQPNISSLKKLRDALDVSYDALIEALDA